MLKRVFNIIMNTLLVFLILIVIFNFLSIFYLKLNNSKKNDLLGYEFFIDTSNSMEPTINKGDFIIAKKTNFSDIKVGDIIIFNNLDNNITIAHRVVGIFKTNSNKLEAITTGDRNNKKNEKTVTTDTFEAKYLFKVPKLGTILLFFSTGIGILTLILIIATIIIISYLFSFVLKKR